VRQGIPFLERLRAEIVQSVARQHAVTRSEYRPLVWRQLLVMASVASLVLVAGALSIFLVVRSSGNPRGRWG